MKWISNGMKINFLVRWLPPRIDGVGDYTWNLAWALRELGIEVRIFTSQEQGCIGLLKNGWIFPTIMEWKPKEVVRALKDVVGNGASDWLCFQYVPQMYGRWGMCWQVADILMELKRKFHCRIAVTFHEFISKWRASLKDIILSSALHLQSKRILCATDLAIATCCLYKDILQRLALRPLTIAVIPVGSNIEPIFIRQDELKAARRQIFPAQAKIFGILSRFSACRNFPLALRALKEARQRGIDAWLILLGNVESSNPKYFKELMLQADKLGVKSYTVSTGELSKEGLSTHLGIVDVFIFPQNDGISTRNTALMAALAFGLPVVSFKPQPGNFDNFYIPCGVLVNKGNEDGFVEAAVSCLKQGDDLSKEALANSDYYYRHFSWPIIAKQYIETLSA